MKGPRLPKPDEFRLSPEAAKGIADFKRALTEMGETMARRANEVMVELAASIERSKP
jgi:hypothetical protein